jgi:hypothetical protein
VALLMVVMARQIIILAFWFSYTSSSSLIRTSTLSYLLWPRH